MSSRASTRTCSRCCAGLPAPRRDALRGAGGRGSAPTRRSRSNCSARRRSPDSTSAAASAAQVAAGGAMSDYFDHVERALRQAVRRGAHEALVVTRVPSAVYAPWWWPVACLRRHGVRARRQRRVAERVTRSPLTGSRPAFRHRRRRRSQSRSSALGCWRCASADPDGGPPWGLRTIKSTTRGLEVRPGRADRRRADRGARLRRRVPRRWTLPPAIDRLPRCRLLQLRHRGRQRQRVPQRTAARYAGKRADIRPTACFGRLLHGGPAVAVLSAI